jgi:hypothetical protein
MSLEADLDRGVRAERLLANPLLIESFDMVRAAIIEKWEASPMRDKEGAHELKLMLKLLTDVRANLEQAVTDGKLAAAELKTQRRELSPAQWRAEVRK